MHKNYKGIFLSYIYLIILYEKLLQKLMFLRRFCSEYLSDH